jgi:hypothetical protein
VTGDPPGRPAGLQPEAAGPKIVNLTALGRSHGAGYCSRPERVPDSFPPTRSSMIAATRSSVDSMPRDSVPISAAMISSSDG